MRIWANIRRGSVAFAALLIPFAAVPAPVPVGSSEAHGPWTKQDLEAVTAAATAAAIETAQVGKSRFIGGKLDELVDALATAGESGLAHKLIINSSMLLVPPDHLGGGQFAPDGIRNQPIEKLVQLGDVVDAEVLARDEPNPRFRAESLAPLGYGL